MLRISGTALCLAICLCVCRAQEYSVTPIEAGSGAVPSRMNNLGHVVGRVSTTGADHGFLWANGVTTLLDAYPPSAFAFDVNDADVCVGSSTDQAGAIVWADGQFHDIGSLSPGRGAGAHGINDLGWIVGGSGVTGSHNRPFFYRGGQMTNMGALPGLELVDGVSTAIDESGFAVGHFYHFSEGFVADGAFYWTEGQGIRLIQLNSSAEDVNDSGQVVGTSPAGAYMWQNGNTTLIGGQHAVAINNNGNVAGWGTTGAWTWQPGQSQVTFLNGHVPSGWSMLFAYDINNSGQILAWGNRAGHEGPVLLTPVPEPSSLIILCSLLLAVNTAGGRIRLAGARASLCPIHEALLATSV